MIVSCDDLVKKSFQSERDRLTLEKKFVLLRQIGTKRIAGVQIHA